MAQPMADFEAACRTVAAGGRAVVQREGLQLAVVPLDDLARLEELDAQEDADLLAASLAAEAAVQERGEQPVPWAAAERRLAET
ncbi:MAG: hypothetical protein IT204_10280 [Fimbriimonadaceae bacterium]|nr:hypothetical protein [Fimbriimonadaceae bacterium]